MVKVGILIMYLENILAVCTKIQNYISFDPILLHLVIHSTDRLSQMNKFFCIKMFLEALFVAEAKVEAWKK